MAKRYLGRSADLTLSRLEEACAALAATPARDDDHSAQRLVRQAGAAGRYGTPDATPSATTGSPSRATKRRVKHPERLTQSSTRLLLSTKLTPPRAGARLVDRPHVVQRLQRGLERPLTLIAAPAGYGKTTALRAWIRELEQSPDAPAIAWVSLDASDNDPAQFWTYVSAALDQAHPGLAANTLAMLHAPNLPPLTTILRALLNAVAALPHEVALVLDDYHLIVRPEIHEALAPCWSIPRRSCISTLHRAPCRRCRSRGCAPTTR